MALVRAFTKRSKHPDISPPSPTRAASARRNGQRVLRHEISAPLELISTTNMLSFNAPDIHSSASSTASGWDSDGSRNLFGMPSAASTDASSIESSSDSVEPNHLSTYFQGPGRSNSTTDSYRKSNSSAEDVPAIPQRALTHTKATHKALARTRSQSQKAPPNSIHTQGRTSVEMFNGNIESSHPFGKELEQVNELAEEFGVRDSVMDESQILQMKGLQKFGAEDYAMEIEGLFGGVFEDQLFDMGAGWI
ncbi:MAG: hypothetical protein M1827_005527 [Pycnora praestabilis]|nr:MAG: hypothetical protein M1827_005527 [Pycnora praestabilis]